MEELRRHQISLDLMPDLFEESLRQALCSGIVSVGKEDGAESDAAPDSFLQRPHTFNGEAAIVGKVTVSVNGTEVFEQGVVAPSNGAEPFARCGGWHKEPEPGT
jgi:hypothetical protein